MKKGFTILELLVASLLLGMLMTILTMIFSQSSIAWRTGTAIVADLDDVRSNVAEVRDEADNAYIWDGKRYSLTGLWDDDNNGNLRKRAWDIEDVTPGILPTSYSDNADIGDFKSQQDVSASGGFGKVQTYTINVKSSGPNKQLGDYDDIWSNPDDFLD